MERSNYRISLDICDSHGACLLDMKRTDTHRRINITLTDGGVPYRITEGCQVVFTAKKPDNTVIYNHCAVEDNTVIYDVTPQTTAAPGLLQCEIRLYDAPVPLKPDENGVLSLPGTDVQLLTSAAFGIRVHPTVYNEEDIPASDTEMTELTKCVTDAMAATNAAQSVLAAKENGEFDGISATHSWDGTVLTVTSASGTSSADLKGEKGDTGEQGPQGEKGDKGDPGEVNIDDTAVGPDAWSSKHLIDRLCPDFRADRKVVRCEPLEGYPLNVVTKLPTSEAGYAGITLTQCGKNLFDYKSTAEFIDYYVYSNNNVGKEGNTTKSSNYACSDYVPIRHLQGQKITLNHPPITVSLNTNAGMAFYDADKVVIVGCGTNGYTATVPDNAEYMRFSVPVAYKDRKDIQIELGSAVTEYEAYREPKVFAVEFPEPAYGGQYNWQSGILTDENGNHTNLGSEQPVIAQAGSNTIYSSVGTTFVICREDLVTTIERLMQAVEKLMQAVISLGGNI